MITKEMIEAVLKTRGEEPSEPLEAGMFWEIINELTFTETENDPRDMDYMDKADGFWIDFESQSLGFELHDQDYEFSFELLPIERSTYLEMAG